MNITSEGAMNISVNEKIDISSNNDMNITANGETMNITATAGDMNISSKNGIDITATAGDINITTSNSNNFSVDSSSFSSTCPITAEVNGVENVYLGCPIGTVVMWVGQTAPNGWFLCNGDRILISSGIPIEQTIQGVDFQKGNLQSLVDLLSGEFGAYHIINIHRSNNEYIADATIDGDTITIKALNADINLAYKFYLNNETTYTITDDQETIFAESDYTKYYVRELPNLQQKFPLGAMQGGSMGLGVTGGTSANTLEMANLPQDMANYYLVTSSSQPQASKSLNDAASGNYFVNEDTCLHSNGIGQPSSTAFTNMPPYLAINFIIKYK
jgi:microcystin-dependent protein